MNLSNEQTVTQWAHPASRAAVRLAPSASSHSFTRLHARTEDGLREVYEALRRQTESSGAVWVQVRLPMRPNGRTGWVPRSALGALHTVYTQLVVRRGMLRV